MLEELKHKVWQANKGLAHYKLVDLTWGNISGMSAERDFMVIKPSGINYEELKSDDLVVVDRDGKKVEGHLSPSSDTPIHLEIYKAFGGIFGVAHTHSVYATMFAQANMSIPCLGTTHADHFYGDIPVTRMITEEETHLGYEANTGKVIVERFEKIDPFKMPAVLVVGHGAFTWGISPQEALFNSVALEDVAKMAFGSILLRPNGIPFPDYLLRKHFSRKHGPDAYYGQKKTGDEQ
ncbi:MAG: L-ribulose-5-phosphate 4-epimerase AraD [Candidatus Aminicenantes bacterium]|nr:L-ribulose-5-phosphate 4-epimerase AraD [Candidatus Aminicenantes bacterium]